MFILKEEDIKKLIQLQRNSRTNDLTTKSLKKNLYFYNYLRENEENIINLNPEIKKESILYSQYYWYVKYKEIYFDVFGYDAGVEQEGFKLLEECDKELEEGIDWNIIKQIENGPNEK